MKYNFLLLLMLFSFMFCKAQLRDYYGTRKWDSAYLKHWVDSTGTLPSNTDLRFLHLGTATIVNDKIDSTNFYFILAFLLAKIDELEGRIEDYKKNEVTLVQTIEIYKIIVKLLDPDSEIEKPNVQ